MLILSAAINIQDQSVKESLFQAQLESLQEDVNPLEAEVTPLKNFLLQTKWNERSDLVQIRKFQLKAITCQWKTSKPIMETIAVKERLLRKALPRNLLKEWLH